MGHRLEFLRGPNSAGLGELALVEQVGLKRKYREE
jgi:hypothetical protein